MPGHRRALRWSGKIYANIRPSQLKRAVAFYEKKAMEMLSE